MFTGGGVKTIDSIINVYSAIDARWSDISLVEQELFLFNKVIQSGIPYSRIHLISGQDMPIKSNDEIHDFFNKHIDVEFIEASFQPRFIKRIKYYHFFVRKRRQSFIYEFLRRVLLVVQICIGVNRIRNLDLKLEFGSEWCSLTLGAVKYIADNYPKYRKNFEYTTASDELYKQMLLKSAEDKFAISPMGNLRFIIFKDNHPSPEILSEKDYDAIINSNCMFARKFDYVKCPTIVDMILNYIKKQ